MPQHAWRQTNTVPWPPGYVRIHFLLRCSRLRKAIVSLAVPVPCHDTSQLQTCHSTRERDSPDANLMVDVSRSLGGPTSSA